MVGWRVVTNGIKANYRLQCRVLFDLIKGVCLFDLIILWDITKTLYLRKRVIMISYIYIYEFFLTI